MASKLERLLKNAYESCRIWLRYRELRPTVVQPPVGDIWLHIDPFDCRARKMITAAAVRGKSKVNQRFWAGAIDRFRPNIAIDVGANFGECLLSHPYAEDTSLHCVEANPRLAPFLESTIRSHPNRSQIHLHCCAAGSVSSPGVDFFIDREWSGGSTLSKQDVDSGSSRYMKASVPAEQIDNLVEQPRHDDRLLFKIDVEGSEPAVLRGMLDTVSAPESLMGMVEFDVDYMMREGFDLNEYWNLLCSIGDVYQVGRRHVDGPLPTRWPAALLGFGSRGHFDVIVARNSLDQADLQQICFP